MVGRPWKRRPSITISYSLISGDILFVRYSILNEKLISNHHMAHISTTARKFRKITRDFITKQMHTLTGKSDKWIFLNPVTNKNVELDALGVEGMLYSMVPAARDAEFKYGQGVARLLLTYSEINSNYRNASDLNDIIKIITSAHVHEWDSNLRSLSIRELRDFFHNETKTLDNVSKESLSKRTFTPNLDYDIVEIHNFEEASQYKQYTTWCITASSGMWDSYSANGINRVYFILKKGYEKLTIPSTNNNKKDEYGLSMISVVVRPYGYLAFCTGRYNHQFGGNDALLNVTEISELVGRNYYDAFLPKSGKELETAIFQNWTEVEPDEICIIKGWKMLKKIPQEASWYSEKTKYTYYDPEMLYLVFDSVGKPDTFGNRVVELNGKYNLINKQGDLIL